ncbi:carbon monoxide dehydrogenase subunit G [Streptacidiphilus sp. MAP12-20]|uniref:SRPBCC family protein n=1 Tax=Streptacidiphilus sp. MAP12-20 TaxID=3156299 RepID=UPI003512F5FB
MLLHHDMTVPASTDEVWRALGEIEEIAPCLPGASVDRVDDDTVYGTMTVKVGPITVAYRGRAVIDERDDASHRMVVHATGREQRGAGTAAATMVVAVHEQDDGATEVDVDTDLTITGRPAQFGRGVMADIGDRVIAEFADRLSQRLAATTAATTAAPPSEEPAAPAPPTDATTPLDLLPVLAPVLRRAALLALTALCLTALARLIRRSLDPASPHATGGR